MYTKIAISAVLILSSVKGVLAETRSDFTTGGGLLKNCQSPDITLQQGCLGYIVGAVDGLTVSSVIAPSYPKNLKICIPDSVEQGQINYVIVKYLETYPEVLHLNAVFSIQRVLNDVFPCE